MILPKEVMKQVLIFILGILLISCSASSSNSGAVNRLRAKSSDQGTAQEAQPTIEPTLPSMPTSASPQSAAQTIEATTQPAADNADLSAIAAIGAFFFALGFGTGFAVCAWLALRSSTAQAVKRA